MEKRQQIEAISGETQLPEEIIQHIQSFLSGKEAAKTTILSKSWYNAWITRPNLDFDGCDFPTPSAFVGIANKILQRYDELNRKIQSFRLKIQSFKLSMDGCESGNISLADELIWKALKLGATDFDIKFPASRSHYVSQLPREVLQSETLARLSLRYCKINHQKISCSRLKYLSLNKMHFEGNTFWDIISTCPSIEELLLSQCKIGEDRKLESKWGFGVYDFHKLKVLSLDKVELGEWLFGGLSRFPCLKELTLNGFFSNKEIRIRSSSLECITLTNYRTLGTSLRATFDVPRVRKFKYSGSRVPSLSFKEIPTEREWESDVTIRFLISCKKTTSWFLELGECLRELSSSKISLRLNMSIFGHNYEFGDIIGLPKPPTVVVENLTLLVKAPSSFHRALTYGLFRCCRPSFVNLYWLPLSQRQSKAINDFTEVLCKQERSISALYDVEVVNVEFFEDDPVKGCTSLPCMTFSDASAYSGSFKIKVCIQLRWGDSDDM